MFRQIRGDTHVITIEQRYDIDLNARADKNLGNLLEERGFDSLTHLLTAARGKATYLARRRRIFLSFHAGDLQQVNGFRLMARNPNLNIDYYDASVTEPIESDRSGYVKQVIRQRIQAASIVLCLIGNRTAYRDWVEWELQTGYELGKGLCGVRLKGARGAAPELLRDLGCYVARWDTGEIIAAIECAAARRS